MRGQPGAVIQWVALERERPWKQQDEAQAGWPWAPGLLRVAESSGADGIPSRSEQPVTGR